MSVFTFSDLAFMGVAAAPGELLDADAAAYITAVETADGQALEAGVRTAINDFVVGCKADGIWNAIKASCIMAGARTLNGALQPLVGTAPTNVGFLDGDYNRKTGVLGNGTKYIDSNRNNNADPQDSQHLACFVSTLGSGVAVTMLTNNSAVGASHIGLAAVRSRNSASIGAAMIAGFNGISRGSAASYVQRVGGASTTLTQASQTPANNSIAIFRSGPTYGTHRLSFYSIGEHLDLALLDTRITTLINAFAAAIP
jgi:hypothetical protein